MSELARRVNLSVSTISRYWSGQRIPNFLIALQIADALDVDPYKLAGLFKHAN
jgi:transcriptional regulator with XRE-family HTH domain